MDCISVGSAEINQWSVVELSAPVSGTDLLLPPDKHRVCLEKDKL